MPTQAVFYDDKGDICFVESSRGNYQKKQVKIGAQNEDIVQIVSGLQVGEKVSLIKPEAN